MKSKGDMFNHTQSSDMSRAPIFTTDSPPMDFDENDDGKLNVSPMFPVYILHVLVMPSFIYILNSSTL